MDEVSHAEFAKVPVRPFFLGESTYEGEHSAWGSALQARKTKRALTMDLGQLTGERLIAWWFNPRTGEAECVGEFTDKKRHAFEPPAAGDWVLVLDDSANNFPSPGTPSLNK
jgi:hypothetical protein